MLGSTRLTVLVITWATEKPSGQNYFSKETKEINFTNFLKSLFVARSGEEDGQVVLGVDQQL